MTREELVDLRRHLLKAVDDRRALGDFDTNAPAIRMALEANLRLTEHLIEQTKQS